MVWQITFKCNIYKDRVKKKMPSSGTTPNWAPTREVIVSTSHNDHCRKYINLLKASMYHQKSVTDFYHHQQPFLTKNHQ